ncbi:MAG: universal stress protein [Thermodesulfobacteriota bacterium]|nr:universal stress protein [Thermodesulfobacteriota bacterium]
MIKRILVGLGGTPFTTVATKIATELGDMHQAQLTGVTVVDTSKLNKVGPVPAGGEAYAQRMRERKAQITQEGTDQAIEAFKAHCSKQKVVCRRIEYEQKDPFDAMISEARYNDLTIFGLRSIFDYGFTTDPDKAIIKLMTQGVRPILAVAETYRPIKKALIAYSGSMESAKAIRHFLYLNPWPGVTLHIIHFKEGPEKEPFLLEDVTEFCEAHGFEVKTDTVEGQARSNLLPFARENNADLIVMGNSVHKALMRRLLGDTVLETIKSADRHLFLSQ